MNISQTYDTPKVSHFARNLGKTGKSTASMARNVKRSICARYVVKAGSCAIAIPGGVVLVDDCETGGTWIEWEGEEDLDA